MTDSSEAFAAGDISGVIGSRQNDRIKRVRKLKQRKYRKQEGRMLIEGVRILEAAIGAGLVFEEVFCAQDFLDDASHRSRLSQLKDRGARVFQVEDHVLDALSEVATPQGICAVVKIPSWDISDIRQAEATRRNGMILWFDAISDPSNFGAILRSAFALGASGYLMSPHCVDRFHPASVRASAGAVFYLAGVSEVDICDVKALPFLNDRPWIGATPKAKKSLEDVDPNQPVLLLVGEEARGLSPEALKASDVKLAIPMTPNADSLNVSAAMAIMMYHFSPWRRKI